MNDFYNEIYQERRCQVGLHNFINFDRGGFFLVCKVCKYLQVGPRKIIMGVPLEEEPESYKSVHQDRDGTININKQY
jgi:hypothetical protein